MTINLRSLLITLAVAALAGFGGVWLGTKVFATAPQRSLHEAVHHELHLDAQQRRQIETLERIFAARRATLELEMRAANAELAAAIREEHGYGPRVTAAVERFHDAMGALQTETIEHVFAMREVMTGEQKERFDDIVATTLTAEPQ